MGHWAVASIWFENWGVGIPVPPPYCVKDLKPHPPRPPTATTIPTSKPGGHDPQPPRIDAYGTGARAPKASNRKIILKLETTPLKHYSLGRCTLQPQFVPIIFSICVQRVRPYITSSNFKAFWTAPPIVIIRHHALNRVPSPSPLITSLFI
jgi:hypothetical protein